MDRDGRTRRLRRLSTAACKRARISVNVWLWKASHWLLQRVNSAQRREHRSKTSMGIEGGSGLAIPCGAVVGRDHRSWTGWYRHMTLAMWAYALWTILRAAHLPPKAEQKKRCQSTRRAAWQRARPRGGSRAAECPRDSPPLLAPGARRATGRLTDSRMVRMAAVAPRPSPIVAR
jgi:hypothetical protein